MQNGMAMQNKGKRNDGKTGAEITKLIDSIEAITFIVIYNNNKNIKLLNLITFKLCIWF